MKYLATILLLSIYHAAQAQSKVLVADNTVPIPKLSFEANGALKITASLTSSQNDFDFLAGKWKMHNRRLNQRLEGCTEWTEFESSDENTRILNGTADMDIYSTNEMPGQEGKHFEGLTVRLFDPKTRLWSLYWVASATGTMDPPALVRSRTISATSSLGYLQRKTDHHDVSLGCSR
jgi:hypothetical protein